MDIEKIYRESKGLLEGHFLLSSGKHSKYYLQSAKVLENPKTAEKLAKALGDEIKKSGIEIDTICAPALGGILSGYELARTLGLRFIFVERKNGQMELRRGFEVSENERVLICEDIVTTGGSAMEASTVIEGLGAKVVGFASLANRGFCRRVDTKDHPKKECKLPKDRPFFALADFNFEIFDPKECPLCKMGDKAIKLGSRNILV